MAGLDAILDELFAVIQARRESDPARSYTAQLLAAGPETCARKVGEEAVETVIAAAGTDKRRLVEESADLLYHLLVLWAAKGVTPDEVGKALSVRRGTSGLDEKAARPKT